MTDSTTPTVENPVHPIIEAVRWHWAEQNHGRLCFCSGWPEACVSGYTPQMWATEATDLAVWVAVDWLSKNCPSTNEDGGTEDGVWFEDQLVALTEAIENPYDLSVRHADDEIDPPKEPTP